MNSIRRTLLLWSTVTFLLAGFARPTRAQTNLPAPTKPERYLLIVDNSAGMAKRSTNVYGAIGFMFSSGLRGQLKSGDTIGVWTYDEELHPPKFPLVRWQPQNSRLVTAGLVSFLQKEAEARGKKSRLAAVLPQLTNVVANSDKITVLIVSDGSDTLSGTPFDAPINSAWALNAAEQRERRMPFITILRAVKGEFVGFTVNTPPWPVEFPPFPAEAAPPVTPVAHPPTATPQAEATPLPSLIVIGKKLAPPVITNQPPVETNQPTLVPPANSVPAAEMKTNEPAAATSAPPPPTAQPPAPEISANAGITAAPQSPEATSPPAQKPTWIPIAIIGGAVGLVLLMLVGWLLLRGKSDRASLITSALHKEDK